MTDDTREDLEVVAEVVAWELRCTCGYVALFDSEDDWARAFDGHKHLYPQGCPGCSHELTAAGDCTFDGCSSSITFEARERSEE